ncbi:MAG: hypothetical protein ABSC10_02600 [Candidatus Acidiferrales bacterium]
MRAKRLQDRQRGGAKLSFAITIIILGTMVFCAVKVVPSWFANYQLQDAITTEARFATSTYPKKTPEDIQGDVFKKASELGVPARQQDIKVTFDGNLVTISLDYSVTYDLAVTQITHQFHLYADSRPI